MSADIQRRQSVEDTPIHAAMRAAILALLLLAFPAHADIIGPARVIDGDTIEVAGERIRLHGIDAPESKQTCQWPGKTIPCGRLATLALMDLTAGAEVTCKTRERDRYTSSVARTSSYSGTR